MTRQLERAYALPDIQGPDATTKSSLVYQLVDLVMFARTNLLAQPVSLWNAWQAVLVMELVMLREPRSIAPVRQVGPDRFVPFLSLPLGPLSRSIPSFLMLTLLMLASHVLNHAH